MSSRTGIGRRGSSDTAAYSDAFRSSPAAGTSGGSGSRRSHGGSGVRRLRLRMIERPSARACSSSSASWSATPDRRVWTSDPPSSSGRHVLAGGGLHQRRPAEEDRAGPADDDGLVAHGRDVGAAGRARAHDQGDLRDPGGRHAGLVVEDPPEVVAIGEDLGLERQEGAAGVDQVDARQPVLERDLLGAEVLLDGHRVVRAALDRGVVGDHHAGRPLDPADPGDDAGARRVVVVQAGRGQRAQLEERRPRVQQAVDPLADRQLAALAMAGDRALVAAGAAGRQRRLSRPQVVDEGRHRLVVGAGLGGRGIEPAAQDGHVGMIGRACCPDRVVRCHGRPDGAAQSRRRAGSTRDRVSRPRCGDAARSIRRTARWRR